MKLKKLKKLLEVVTLGAVAPLLTACGSNSPNPPDPPAVSVNFNPQPASSIDAATTTKVTAVVANDTTNSGVKWSVSCGGSQCGSFSSPSTSSGASTSYTAPANVPSPATVTITATSAADGTKSASGMIAISAADTPISVTLSPAPPASLAIDASATIGAKVSNDDAEAGVTWSAVCGSSQCGSFSQNSTASGAQTFYTAPTTVPSAATVTVTATSVTDKTRSTSATINITAPPPVLADGNYTFHLAGEDGSGPYFIAGVFTVQSNKIAGGEQDLMDNNGAGMDTIDPNGSSLSVANGNIQIVLNTNDPSLGVNGIETLRGSTVSTTRILISEFDTSATGSGSADLQTSTASPAGGYAFNLGGLDGNGSNQLVLMIGGILNVGGGSLSARNSVFDYNDGGNIGQGQTFASGSITGPDNFGRVVFTLNPSASSGVPGLVLAGYTVSPNEIQLVELGNDALGGDLGGMALGQGSNTGRFSQASVAGQSYAFGALGEDSDGNILQLAGGLGLNGNGTVSGALAWNDLDVQAGSKITSGTYTVDATGRVTLSVVATVTPANAPQFTVPFAFQLYLDGNGNALEVGVDKNQATTGRSYVQTASSATFDGSYALSAQGFGGFNNEPAWTAVGSITVASGAFAGATDFSVQNADNSASTTIEGVPLSGSEDDSTGLLSLIGLNAQSPAVQAGFGYYPIDSHRVIAIEVDDQQLGLLWLEGTQPN